MLWKIFLAFILSTQYGYTSDLKSSSRSSKPGSKTVYVSEEKNGNLLVVLRECKCQGNIFFNYCPCWIDFSFEDHLVAQGGAAPFAIFFQNHNLSNIVKWKLEHQKQVIKLPAPKKIMEVLKQLDSDQRFDFITERVPLSPEERERKIYTVEDYCQSLKNKKLPFSCFFDDSVEPSLGWHKYFSDVFNYLLLTAFLPQEYHDFWWSRINGILDKLDMYENSYTEEEEALVGLLKYILICFVKVTHINLNNRIIAHEVDGTSLEELKFTRALENFFNLGGCFEQQEQNNALQFFPEQTMEFAKHWIQDISNFIIEAPADGNRELPFSDYERFFAYMDDFPDVAWNFSFLCSLSTKKKNQLRDGLLDKLGFQTKFEQEKYPVKEIAPEDFMSDFKLNLKNFKALGKKDTMAHKHYVTAKKRKTV